MLSVNFKIKHFLGFNFSAKTEEILYKILKT